MSENSAKALRNAIDTGLDVQNEIVKSRQQNVMNDEIARQNTLKENIQNDKVLLAKLEKELAALKNGNDVEIRRGEQMMPQNLTPTMQTYMDNLKKTDENKSFWNFKPAEVFNG
jgi:hypothetical protein